MNLEEKDVMAEYNELKEELLNVVSQTSNPALENEMRKKYSKKQEEEYKLLSKEEKELLKERAEYQAKGFNGGCFGSLIMLLYLFVGMPLVWMNLPNSSETFIVSMVLLAVAVIMSVAVTKTINSKKRKKINEKIAQISAIPAIQRYDEIANAAICEYEKEQSRLKSIRNELMEKMQALKEKVFNIKYQNCIVFYGNVGSMMNTTTFTLYLDGVFYQEVKGKRLVKIMLNQGVHSLRVEETKYNGVDKSVIYQYTYGPLQMRVGNEPEAFAILCDGQYMGFVSAEKMEKVAKVELI